MARYHRISVLYEFSGTVEGISSALASHVCGDLCARVASVFNVEKLAARGGGNGRDTAIESAYPPTPAGVAVKARIAHDWVSDSSEVAVKEFPCCVCARLTLQMKLLWIKQGDIDFSCLNRKGEGVTRAERFSSDEPVREIEGPILERAGIVVREQSMVYAVCSSCFRVLRRQRIPRFSLANGRWLGNMPGVYRKLNFVEQIAMAPLRHSFCVGQVSLGQHFLSANVVVFGQPVGKMWSALPPPKVELAQTLAILFTGPAKPSDADIRRTPFLIRHSVLVEALSWAKLNSSAYDNVEINLENLREYSESEPPVGVIYRRSSVESTMSSSAAYQSMSELGVEDGECPFIVHALTGHDLTEMTYEAKVACAIKYFESGHKALAYGHERHPESIYHNPALFPGMFPWLYPYGLGGFDNARMVVRLDHINHVRANLLYCDRRFQEDKCYPFIVFNQRQIKSSSQGGYLLTKRANFRKVADNILSLDRVTLDSIADRAAAGEHVVPRTDAEKACFDVIGIVDQVAGHVEGSNTSRKYMRSQIKSLIYVKGLPVFFITFAPADYKHPLCLYFCGEQIDLSVVAPNMKSSDERLRTVAHNPVGAARFFDFIVNLFIRDVLRYGRQEDGLFGRTESYYGTVESQVRLTLHLHTLVWITNSIGPQEFCDRLLADSRFESDVLDWLEECHRGGYSHLRADELSRELEEQYVERRYGNEVVRSRLRHGARDPATTLPFAPGGSSEQDQEEWLVRMEEDSDRVVFVSNRHDKNHGKGCWRAKPGYCRARFPRELVPETVVDRGSGAVKFAKSEEWINTFNSLLAFLLRCNHDVTCLANSSTQVSSAAAYITDYVTKGKLTTEVFFDTVRAVLDKTTDSLVDAGSAGGDVARSIMVKLVNAFSASAETGGPMVCAYLLGQPDHYTNHVFKVVHWFGFCREASAPFEDLQAREDSMNEGVVLGRSSDGVVALNKVKDYTCHPMLYASWCLYDYLRCVDVRKLRGRERNLDDEDSESELDNEDADDDGQNVRHDGSHSSPAKLIGDHPYRASHAVYRRDTGKEYILNFTGGMLPRHDKGDWESYCKTMLVLFKPGGWRSGHDIKEHHTKWSTVFDSTPFAGEHIRVMRNMNLLYECYDAQDDYAAQRRAMLNGDVIVPNMPRVDAMADAETESRERGLDDIDYELNEDGLTSILHQGNVGQKTAKNRLEMDSMQKLLRGDKPCPCPRVGSQVGASSENVPQKPPSQWRSLVQTAKLAIIDAMRSRPDSSSYTDHQWEDFESTHAAEVRIIDKAEWDRLSQAVGRVLRCPQYADILLLHGVIEEFTLNAEQLRAFLIAATHLHHRESEALHMFVAGMAGTGKSRVVLSLMMFLERRAESHRFMVLGPTGTSASLVGGSTYHSVLGFTLGGEKSSNSLNTLPKVRSRLSGVDLIFIDEVSMISCLGILFIHEQLTKAFDDLLQNFGGKSIVFAGDFAQLPPPGRAPALYSGRVGECSSLLSDYDQRCTYGKALWHLFTTVVVLRRNMQQTGVSERDKAFRECLVRMRLARCSDEDVRLLRTRTFSSSNALTGRLPDRFQFISIITARNAHRDAVNALRAKEFAAVTGKRLYRFHSVDAWAGDISTESVHQVQRLYRDTVDPVRSSDDICTELQVALWELPPSLSGHHAGVLELCEGMPVLLKQNEVTELCATNGAEAVVHSWVSRTHRGQLVLQTLFIKLVNPPRPLHLDGLETNVIPICQTRKTVRCMLPVEDISVSISREQVSVLPNFAMTDFASQGRTRELNVVHLIHCRNHQSVYTCLSRSSSLEDTLILGPFDARKIQGGASISLRREFREIDLLDDATCMRFEGSLPSSVTGVTRHALLSAFLAWRGQQDDPAELLELSVSRMPEHDRAQKSVTKRKHISTRWGDSRPRKRLNATIRVDESAYDGGDVSAVPGSSGEIRRSDYELVRYGLIWDSISPSCAYDAVFTILWNIFCDKGEQWFGGFADTNWLAADVRSTFVQAQGALEHLEYGRNRFRDVLGWLDPVSFPRQGAVGTSVSDIARLLFMSTVPFGDVQAICPSCNCLVNVADDIVYTGMWCAWPPWWEQTFGERCTVGAQEFLQCLVSTIHMAHCERCGIAVEARPTIAHAPPFLMVESQRGATISPDRTVVLQLAGHTSSWTLSAVVYYGDHHYTVRYINSNYKVWYHDGIATRRHCVLD